MKVNKKCKLPVYWGVVFCLIGVMSSCSAGLYERLNRKDIIPAISAPSAHSFAVEHGIVLTMDDDPGADEYVLYKDTSPAGSFTNKIYQGTERTYTDYAVDDEVFYYYKLAKIKGGTEFDKSETVAAITGPTICDIYESNNSKAAAAALLDRMDANFYFYRNHHSTEAVDADWYKVTVPPRNTVRLEIRITSAGYTANSLQYNEEGGATQGIINGSNFQIDNNGLTSKTCYFQISADRGRIGVQEMITYRVVLLQIVPM